MVITKYMYIANIMCYYDILNSSYICIQPRYTLQVCIQRSSTSKLLSVRQVSGLWYTHFGQPAPHPWPPWWGAWSAGWCAPAPSRGAAGFRGSAGCRPGTPWTPAAAGPRPSSLRPALPPATLSPITDRTSRLARQWRNTHCTHNSQTPTSKNYSKWTPVFRFKITTNWYVKKVYKTLNGRSLIGRDVGTGCHIGKIIHTNPYWAQNTRYWVYLYSMPIACCKQ